MTTKWPLLLFLLALPLRAQLVFDQNSQIIRTGLANLNSADWWVITAETSELACRGWKDEPIPCRLGIVVRSDSDAAVLIDVDDLDTIDARRGSPALRDRSPSFPALPWSSGPIAFSGSWEYAHAFGSVCPAVYIPCCLIPDLDISVGESYSGSFDFDQDGGGNPINVSVSFTLSEVP